MAGIYVHIPFCGQRCIYCDFFSTVGLQHLAGDYVNALLVEARLRVAELGKDVVRTLYVGGGTPSTLSAEQWQRLIAGLRERFMLSELDEFTVEVNPDDVTQAYMENLHRLGVNRVSMCRAWWTKNCGPSTAVTRHLKQWTQSGTFMRQASTM